MRCLPPPLANLVDAGSRTAAPTRPNASTTSPTDKARALGHVLMMMAQWGETWLPTPTARPLVRRHTPCGHTFKPTLVCSECREYLEPGAVEYPAALETDRRLAKLQP